MTTVLPLQIDPTQVYLGVLLVALVLMAGGILLLKFKVSREEHRKKQENLRGWYKYTLFLAKRIQRTLHENPTTPQDTGARNEVQKRMSQHADELKQHKQNRPADVEPRVVSLVNETVRECRELEGMPTRGTSYTFDVTGETIDTGDEVKQEFIEKAKEIAEVASELEEECDKRIDENTTMEEFEPL